MKKVISSLLVMSMVFCASVSKADNLTVEQAKAIGAYYMAHETGIEKLSPADLTLAYRFENPDMDVASAYLFNLSDCGWIIVAGSSVVDPVIAFSEEGSLDMSNIPDNLRWWITRYTDVVADIQRLDAENDYPDSEEYTLLANKGLKGTKDQKIVLMSTRWDQGDTQYPTYNYYCPTVNGLYCVTGCVATALAQLCRYYRYPVQPKGLVTDSWTGGTLRINLDTVQFDYSMMPEILVQDRYGNIYTDMDTVREVAELNYCLGVASKMDYSPEGSGATMADLPLTMKNKFKFQKPTMQYRTGTDDTSFLNTMRRYLLAHDVVVMRGRSSVGSGADAAGHAWVACGYYVENTSKYYMNWGWGGTGNGWYNVADNNMYISSQGYNFNLEQACLFGLIPPEDSNIHHPHHASILDVDQTILGTAYPNPAEFSVSLPYSTENATDMMVYSVDGKLMATRRVQPGSGIVTLRVDALPKGVYIYRMNGKSGKFIVR